MLYVARCRLCNFLMLSTDVSLIKELIAGHFYKSHGCSCGFVADVPLKDFEEVSIVRIRNKLTIQTLKAVVKNPHFWHTYRNQHLLAKATP